MALSLPEVVGLLPDVIDLVSAVEACAKAEAAAVSLADKVKAAEPVIEKVAALVDKVKALAAS